jgi:hypothetical protein
MMPTQQRHAKTISRIAHPVSSEQKNIGVSRVDTGFKPGNVRHSLAVQVPSPSQLHSYVQLHVCVGECGGTMLGQTKR